MKGKTGFLLFFFFSEKNEGKTRFPPPPILLPSSSSSSPSILLRLRLLRLHPNAFQGRAPSSSARSSGRALLPRGTPLFGSGQVALLLPRGAGLSVFWSVPGLSRPLPLSSSLRCTCTSIEKSPAALFFNFSSVPDLFSTSSVPCSFLVMASASQNGGQNSPAAVASCGLVKPTGDNLDMAWQWNSLKDINNKRYVTCDFCGKVTTGGITRAKRHQIGLKGDVGPCRKIPPEIKKLMKDAYVQKLAEKDAYNIDTHEDDEMLEEVQEIHHIKNGKRSETASSGGSNSTTAAASKRVKGPPGFTFF